MPLDILSSRDRQTPLRLLGLMPDWGDESLFQQIWGEQLGSHFWRKFTVERQRNVNNFVLELDSQPEKRLWQFLVSQSHASITVRDEQRPSEFMIFYRRNQVGEKFNFISLPMLAITHEFIGNIEADTPEQAMFEMHPDTWDTDHDMRVQNNRIIWRKTIDQGDIILQYDAHQIIIGWMVKCSEEEDLYLEELPPW